MKHTFPRDSDSDKLIDDSSYSESPTSNLSDIELRSLPIQKDLSHIKLPKKLPPAAACRSISKKLGLQSKLLLNYMASLLFSNHFSQ